MQNFKASDCAAFPIPTGVNYTTVGTLTDERDGKQYQVRKFADGKCWMVDNLAYGGASAQGGSDACAGRTAFSSRTNSIPTNRFGIGTYGDCRDPAAAGNGDATYCATGEGAGKCGYHYSWQAAMQHPAAVFDYYNQTVFDSGVYAVPANDVVGLCPRGWHLPIGGSSSEFSTLHSQAGSPTTGFWQT